MGSGAHFHQGEVGADEHLAGSGHEQRPEAGIARDLLQVGREQDTRPETVPATR